MPEFDFKAITDRGETNFLAAVSTGQLDGYSKWNVQGLVDNPTSGVWTDITPIGVQQYIFPDSAGEAMELVSTSASDTGQDIHILGLDENGLEKELMIQTAGLTPIAVGNWSAINRAINMGDPSTVGIITVQGAGGGTTFAAIDGNNASTQAVYVVPSNKIAYPLELIATMRKEGGADNSAVVRVEFIFPGKTTRVFGFAAGLQRTGDTSPEFNNPLPDSVPPGTKIAMEVEPQAAGMAFLARMSVLLKEI